MCCHPFLLPIFTNQAADEKKTGSSLGEVAVIWRGYKVQRRKEWKVLGGKGRQILRCLMCCSKENRSYPEGGKSQ